MLTAVRRLRAWTPREIVETYSDVSLDPADIEKMVHYHRPVLMYNAMFNPVKNYTYDGIIWYQGCSNVGRHEDYPVRLSNMVEHWRKEIGEREIPFYSVEIAPYEYGSADGKSWAPLLREAQWKATDIIPNSGIICTNDLVKPYERFNIHPSDKATPESVWLRRHSTRRMARRVSRWCHRIIRVTNLRMVRHGLR